MKNLARLAVLLALSALSVGCNQSTADKQAKDVKKAMQAETDAENAVVKGAAEKADIDEKTAARVEKDEEKEANALEKAVEAGNAETK